MTHPRQPAATFVRALASVVGLSLLAGCTTIYCLDMLVLHSLDVTADRPVLAAAAECDAATSCDAEAGCSTLSLPAPATGGSCPVAVTLVDGTRLATTVDWGAIHFDSCGQASYDHQPSVHVTYVDGAPQLETVLVDP